MEGEPPGEQTLLKGKYKYPHEPDRAVRQPSVGKLWFSLRDFAHAISNFKPISSVWRG